MLRRNEIEMVRSVRDRRVVSVLASVLTMFTLAAGTSAWAAPGAAEGAAAHAAPKGAGYVASPAAVHTARMTVDVPTLHCVRAQSMTLAEGMSGTVRAGSHLSAWNLSVTASCQGSTASYRGVERDRMGSSTLLRVHPGDRIKLLLSGAQTYEIDDLTTGAGVGAGSAGGPGEQPGLATPVLFGAQVSGNVSRALHLRVLVAHVNGKALGSVSHHRQRQLSAGHTVAEPTGLDTSGAFTIAVARTPAA